MCYVFYYFNAARESRTGAWVRLSTQEGKQIFVYSMCVFLLFLCAPGVSHDMIPQCNIRSHNKHFYFLFIAALLVTVYHEPAYDDDDRCGFTKTFSFFCIAEGEDCERNRDADHSEKSKKVYLNVTRTKICLINVVVFGLIVWMCVSCLPQEKPRREADVQTVQKKVRKLLK